ncbi:MAG: hypothetical protein KF713_19920, partial [Turneriella sp.]|nr:hypothetical protein [Turneriella sp.]
MKALIIGFLASLSLWPQDIAEYKFVPNFPNRRVASYFVSEIDLKAIELNAGVTEKTKFAMPLVEVEYGSFHIDDLEQRRKDWLSKAEPHVSEIKISTLLGKLRLSALLRSKDDPQFKVTYVAYILYEAPKLYSLVRVFFPIDDGSAVTEQKSEKILTQLFDPSQRTQTYILKPVFPDSNFFSFDITHSQQAIHHYSNDIHSFENIKKHLISDDIAKIDQYFESKARRNLSYLKPQKITLGKAGSIHYDK